MLFSQIFVTTEDEAISRISEEFGAQIIVRPPKLADDFSSTLDVMVQATEALELEESDLVCCLYPVTPLLNFSRIEQATQIIRKSDPSYVFPALPLNNQIQRAFNCEPDGQITSFDPEKSIARTQDLGIKYVDAGQFYLGKAKNWRNRIPIISTESRAILMNPWEVLDVDTPEDWEVMESLYHLREFKLTQSFHGGKIQ
jgi:N-acylneuraminate cytidylyltransferase